MESIFTRMLKGDEPCVMLAQDAFCAAILEPCPSAPGHAIVFPKKSSDAIFELSTPEWVRLARFARKVARALKSAVPCKKIALVAYGLKVRHAHLHLIPVRGKAGEIALDKRRPAVDPASLERLARKIRGGLKRSR